MVNESLHLAGNGGTIRLQEPPRSSPSDRSKVCIVSKVEIPPYSEMEVLARVDESCEGEWLLEESSKTRAPVAVARSLVRVTNSNVPVLILNPRAEPVTLYAGTGIAVLERVESPEGSVNVVDNTIVTEPEEEVKRVLWELAEKAGPGLTSRERETFLHLLVSYADIFAKSTTDLGRTDVIKHSIHTGNAAPVRQAVRRISPHRRQEVRTLLSEMMERGVVEPSTSPWASPVVLVQKKDGSTRFCVDYRKVNDVTRKDAYPIPRIDTTLDTLAGARWFTTLDLLSGYWQVEIDENDREKTAFCTTESLFQFRVMPFGLCNALATFQRLMDLVLAGLQWSRCLVYIDDIIVLGHSFSNHLHNLESVFSRLHKSGLKLKPSKCSFLQQRVQYLGHIISRDGVSADPSKVQKVVTWPAPISIREVQRFLGFASYHGRFVRNFAQIAKPLHRLTERTATFRWTSEAETAFNELRHQLSSAPILAHPNFERPFILDTDASDVGIGAVLSQQDDEGRERVIMYGSHLLSKPERKYYVTH